ncbi:MAG: ATP-dependent DNA ligase [Actinomycetota bacterium]|nr:ATP-dependent DNA ligase [Actinomycetota bacterium]
MKGSARLAPPVEPMLAKLARDLPESDDVLYEPKWDGFRCIIFRDGDDVDMRSRNQRPLARYFPELVDALRALRPGNFVVDGEIVVIAPKPFDFSALLQRLHPAKSRVERLAKETPAAFIAFDLLAIADEDVTRRPLRDRRELLDELLGTVEPPLYITPSTTDVGIAKGWLARAQGGGADGVIAKGLGSPYVCGKRSIVKVKHERTADCVIAGFRWDRNEPVIGSLLLGIYDGAGILHHIGLASSFTRSRRKELVPEVIGHVTELEGHPWANGFELRAGAVGRLPGAASRWAEGGDITWVPLRPALVAEVAYDHLELDRLRHPARFKRWRPDRDPSTCTFDQFEEASGAELMELLVGRR